MTTSNSASQSTRSWRKKLARWRRSLGGVRPEQDLVRTRRLISESGLFDADWYLERYPDVAAAGLDPLDHYASHGGREGRKASQDFDSRWYMDHYDDVASSGLHPLVHYLEHGEGRQVTKRVGIRGVKATAADFDDANEILASSLFDAAWYAHEHQLDTNPQATALHYLKIGASAGFPASPRFDGRAYLRAYGDVREANVNPLLHFIRHGASENRKTFIAAYEPEAPAPFAPREVRRIAQAGADPRREAADWLTSDRLKSRARIALIQFGDLPMGLLAEVYDNNTSPLPDSLRSALDQFCGLRGLDRTTLVTARIGRSARRIPDLAFPDPVKSPAVTDGWFINDNVLRLRFEASRGFEGVVRLFQTDPDGAAVLVGESPMIGEQAHLIDANLLNNFQPILIACASGAGVLTGGALIPFPSLFRAGAHSGEAEVWAEGVTGAARREGLSAALLSQALSKAPPSGGAGRAVSTLRIDLEGATGAERIFRPAVQQWLAGLGVGIEPVPPLSPKPGSGVVTDHLVAALSRVAAPQGRPPGSVLTLPCDALPTLSVLLSRTLPAGRRVGAYVVADASTSTPRWMVSMPAKDDGLLELQPAASALPYPLLSTGNADASSGGRTGVLAIRFRDPPSANEPTLTYPVAPDAVSPVLVKPLSAGKAARVAITALILVDDALKAAGLLESLARQTLASRLNLVVALRGNADDADTVEGVVGRLFPGRYRILPQEDGPAATLNAAAEAASGRTEMLLVAHQEMVLHDARTLETLYRLASRRKTATAACVRIREGGFRDGEHLRFQCGGIFPSRISFQISPTLAFTTPETSGAFPLATYPVAGNDFGLVMIPVAAWKALGGLDADACPVDGYGLDFCLRALKAGYGHLCTSATTATNLGATAFSGDAAVPGAGVLDITEWAHALEGVAILRMLD